MRVVSFLWITQAVEHSGLSTFNCITVDILVEHAHASLVLGEVENMFELQVTKTAPQISTLLMARGTALPPVLWSEGSNSTAKKTLDTVDDPQLFAPDKLANELMGGAIRSLLYLWNGWPNECSMYAQAAPAKESLYLMAIAERQRGNAGQAKSFFQQLEDHEIYARLFECATEIVGSKADASLGRFGEILKFNGVWEPFAFTDMFEQARADDTKIAVGEFVRKMLLSEFNLLFAHCYKSTTGEDLFKRSAAGPDPAKKIAKEDMAAKRDRLIREKAVRSLRRSA